jgi:WD40 repeat protein
LGGLAWVQRGVADRRAAENRVRELTSEARLAIEDDPELAVLLALEAHDMVAGLDDRLQGEVAAALQETTQASRLVGVIPHGDAFLEASPDGRLLVVDAGDGTTDVVVYDQATAQEIARFDPGFAPGGGAFSPDGSLLALTTATPGNAGDLAGTGDYALKLIDTVEFQEVAVLGSRCCAIRPRFNADGSWIGAEDVRRDFVAWNLRDGTERQWPGVGESTSRWMPGSSAVVQVSAETEELVARDVVTGDTTPLGQLPSAGTEWIDVHPSGESVVAVGDSGIHYWRIDEGDEEWTITEAGLLEAEFSPDGSKVALFGGSDQVLVVSTDSGESLSLRGHAGGASSVAFSAGGERIFVREEGSQVRIWALGVLGRPALGNLAVGGIPDRAFMWSSPDAERLAVAESHEEFEQIVVHDLANGGPPAHSMEFMGRPRPVASHSGRFAGGGVPGPGGVIQDLETGEIVDERGCRAPIAISDDARFAALRDTCGDDTLVELTNLDSDEVLQEWISPTAAIGPAGTPAEGLVAYHPLPFDVLHIVSLATGELLDTLEHGSDARFAHFSPDGRYLSFGTTTGGGWVIDLELFHSRGSLEESVVLRAVVEGGITATAVAAGGMAATSHSGELVRVWDIDTGTEWATIPIATGAQSQLSFTAGARYLYYQSGPGVVARMPLDLEELAGVARSSVFRGFTVAECERYAIAPDCSMMTAAVEAPQDAAS